MIRRFRKPILTAFCSLVIVTATTLPTQAGIVTDAWHVLFGPPGSPWFPGLTPGAYRANYYGPGTYTGYYRPRLGLGYLNTYSYRGNPCCQPVTYCNPCAVVGNNCAVSYGPRTAQIKPKAQNNGEVPKTYGNEGTGDSTPAGEGDSNFEKKDEAPGFGPTRESEKQSNEEADIDGFSQPKKVEVQKVTTDPNTPETIIKQRKPAPADPPKEDDKQTIPADNSKEKESRVTPLNLDRKIVWRSTPRRTRLVIRSRLITPVVARTKVNPNRDWTPVPQGTKIASN